FSCIFPLNVAFGNLSLSRYFSLKCSCISALANRNPRMGKMNATSPLVVFMNELTLPECASIFSRGASEKKETVPFLQEYTWADELYAVSNQTNRIVNRITSFS